MSIQIVTDSTSDIPNEILKSYPITVVPLYINLNNRSFLDGKELSRNDFYEALPTAHPHPTTAAPSPGQFIEVYEDLANKGASAIFSIHIAASLSAVFSSAQAAASQFKRVPVYPIDSGNLSMAEGFIVWKAAQAAQDGKSEDEIAQIIKNTIPKAYAYAKLDTIDYLLKGGRMSSIQHTVVGLLGIKPILKMNNYVSKMEIARTKSRAFERVIRVAADAVPFAEKYGITHANAQSQVERFLNEFKKMFSNLPEPWISEVTPSLGTHVGPGTLCFNWIEKENVEIIEEKKGIRKWFS